MTDARSNILLNELSAINALIEKHTGEELGIEITKRHALILELLILTNT